MTTTAGIRIDPEALLDVRRELLRMELALGSGRVPAPDTGPTTALTARVLDEVAATVAAITADLHGLADALDRLVGDLTDQDDHVYAMYALLRMRSLA